MGQSEGHILTPTGWEIDLATHELWAHGVSVPIGSRAFEIMEILVTSAGKLVTKDDLMRRVWPGAIVEDNTISGSHFGHPQGVGCGPGLAEQRSPAEAIACSVTG